MRYLLILSALLLQSCSTIEIAHAPLNCLNYPETSLSDRMTDKELSSISNEAFDKLVIHIISYQERMNSQCELIKKHNELHDNG